MTFTGYASLPIRCEHRFGVSSSLTTGDFTLSSYLCLVRSSTVQADLKIENEAPFGVDPEIRRMPYPGQIALVRR
jgi:hypothetical protein